MTYDNSHHIAVIDKTGRGHALCDKLLRQNPEVVIHYIPGTAGKYNKRIQPYLDIEIDDSEAIAKQCKDLNISLAIVSHIDAIRAGVSDRLRKENFTVIGASRAASILETSKWYCKILCADANIPTAKANLFTSEECFSAFLQNRGDKAYFVKYDGLTKNGNGAFKITKYDTLFDIFVKTDLIRQQNKSQSFRFLVEECISGTDYSAHYLISPYSIIELPSSLDYKRCRPDSTSMNCDGMGSIAPHPLHNDALGHAIKRKIIIPLVKSLKKRGLIYYGPIFLGLMIDEQSNPILLEINARMGDSETEAILPLINENLAVLFRELHRTTACDRQAQTTPETSVVVSLVTGAANGREGWPKSNKSLNETITFMPDKLRDDACIYWANGISYDGREMVARSGRIAHISAKGSTLAEARLASYNSLSAVTFKNMYFREDIGDL